MTHIKICGITNTEDALCAARAGADYLGFIFYPKSPRYVTPAEAWEVVQAVRKTPSAPALRYVGVFVNAPLKHVCAVLDGVGLDLAQLHGDEPLCEVQRLGARAFKAIRPQTVASARDQAQVYARPASETQDTPELLVDAYRKGSYGGTGLPVDLEIARDLAGRYRLLLAGGLTPQNVGQVVASVDPWGVDVSSGVERTEGRKDHARVLAFIEAVRNSSCQGKL